MRFSMNIESITQRRLPTHWIGKWIKEELGYVYKRGNSRSILSRNPKLKFMQCIFGDRVMRMISNKKVIINIDEATYSNSIKCNYSWLPRGQSNAIINMNCSGKTNVIFGLSTDGNWMATFSNLSTDSFRFWRYLLLLKNFVELWMKVATPNVNYTLDNSPIHVSWKTKKAAEYLEMKLFLLPPYSPSLAPTEWVFGISKKILANQRKVKVINFSKEYGKMMIVESLKKIDQETGVRIWMQFVKSVHQILCNIKTTLLMSEEEEASHEDARIEAEWH